MKMDRVLEQVRFHTELQGLSEHTIVEYRTKANQFQKYYGKSATLLNNICERQRGLILATSLIKQG